MQRTISPLFTFTIGSTGTWIAPLNQMPYSKYTPYNYLHVTNHDTADITLTINGSIKKTIPAGTIMEFQPPEVMAIHHIRIDGISTANAVEVSIMRRPTIWDAINRIAGRWI